MFKLLLLLSYSISIVYNINDLLLNTFHIHFTLNSLGAVHFFSYYYLKNVKKNEIVYLRLERKCWRTIRKVVFFSLQKRTMHSSSNENKMRIKSWKNEISFVNGEIMLISVCDSKVSNNAKKATNVDENAFHISRNWEMRVVGNEKVVVDESLELILHIHEPVASSSCVQCTQIQLLLLCHLAVVYFVDLKC